MSIHQKRRALRATLKFKVMPDEKPAYKRILLKLSGEALMGDDAYGVNPAVIDRIVGEIKEVSEPRSLPS